MENQTVVNVSVVKEVDTDSLGSLDLRYSGLMLGVRLESKDQDKNWLALDKEDWRLLRLLLSGEMPRGVNVMEISSALVKLKAFADVAVQWYERTGVVPRPEYSGVGE